MRTMAVTTAVAVATLAWGGLALAQSTPHTGQTQEPTYACSIKVPKGGEGTMASLAKITLAQATQAAQAAVPGQVLRAGLDDENACLVYSVEIQAADGKIHDLKIDAGTAKVVHQETATSMQHEDEGSSEGANDTED